MKGLTRTLVGLGAAQVAFAATFRGPRAQFWQRMTITGATLGSYALAMSPQARRDADRAQGGGLGLGSAAVLYATFWVGDRVRPARRSERRPGHRRDLRPPGAPSARRDRDCAWPRSSARRRSSSGAASSSRGSWPLRPGQGTALGVAAYGGVHVVTGNFTLLGAATVAGAWWGLLYALGMPLGALVVSHVAWDIWIFLLQPTNEVATALPE